MTRRLLPRFLLLSTVVGVLAAASTPSVATEIWSGRTFSFTKAAFTDPTLAANQDRLTPLVWITRGNSQGIFNAQVEAAFVHNVSPAGTEWATGDAINHASLTFLPWEQWAISMGGPPQTPGVNAVVHLISEDIFVDVVFDAWGQASGGGFTYRRGVPPATPTRPSTWGRIKSLYR
jgi:hypothetical protein